MPYIGYSIILVICLVVILVAFNKINQRAYPYILYGIATSMVLMATLAGPYLVGSDIHGEYYLAQLHSGKDVWPPVWDYPQATAIGNTIIAPLIHKIFQIPLMWIYKAVYPLLFAFVPVILYFVFTRWISRKEAFLASFFFIAFPAFFLELPMIPRQMLSETFLALTLFLIIASNLKLRYKAPSILACGLLVILTHYATGVILLVFLIVGLVVKLSLRVKEGLPAWTWSVVLVVLLVSSLAYFSTASSGVVMWKLVGFYNSFVPMALEIPREKPVVPGEKPRDKPIILVERPSIPTKVPASDEPIAIPKPEESGILDVIPFSRYEVLMEVAFGRGFSEASLLGKLFRAFQWIVMVLIPVGLWLMRRNRKYLVFASGAVFILMLCLVPGFSSTMNITRLFHLALFTLAPAFVIGGKWVCRKPQIFVLCILIPYFLFSSGFVFEVVKREDINKIDIPYNVALSDHRMDLGATFTENDVAVRDWIVKSKMPFPLYADLFTAYFVSEETGYRPEIIHKLPRNPVGLVSPPYFVFVKERNVWDNKLTVWVDIGCRKHIDPEEYGFNINENIVYQVGDARVIEVK